ncbi:MAG: translation initiation factor IF-3 [Acidimicrobiales bacterium]
MRAWPHKPGGDRIATAPITNEPRINDRIRAREVRLVDADGQQLGIKPLPEALQIAQQADLDLVEVAPQASPPVCRIMDYGKFKFDAAQKAKESRRKSTSVGIKEMKYRPKIGPGDFETKTRQVGRFLGEGHKVKVTIMFRGREMSHPELGKRILDRVAEEVGSVAKVESAPKVDGRNMIMVLAPDRRSQAVAAKAKEVSAEGHNGVVESPELSGEAHNGVAEALTAAAEPDIGTDDGASAPATVVEQS